MVLNIISDLLVYMKAPHLQAIYSQTTSGLRSTILQLGDYGVMDVFLLFAQELSANRVERIATELVFTLHVLQNINLETAI